MPVANAGLDLALDVLLHGTAAPATWYVGLIGSTSYTGQAAADTMATHAGWVESTAYTEATRQAWVEGAASAQETGTTTEAVFTINTAVTIKGLFLVSDSTKGGVAGTLLLTKLFDDGDRTFASGEQLRVSFSLAAQDATNTN